MRVVIDTNVILASLPKTSRFRPLIQALVAGKFELVVSTAILLEYQEVLQRKTNEVVANNFLEFLVTLPTVVRVGTPFTWGIIEADPDDNKFVDAGLIAGADYIITNDAHFNMLKQRAFPSIGLLTPDEFLLNLA